MNRVGFFAGMDGEFGVSAVRHPYMHWSHRLSPTPGMFMISRMQSSAQLIAETRTVERDVARTLERAADLADAAGEGGRAAQARDLARRQWGALGT